MAVVSDLTIEALERSGNETFTNYTATLTAACEKHPPPYGMSWYGDRYREVACDPSWLANSLIANAAKEGEGSRKLWLLAGRTGDVGISEEIRLHAIDEARHARLYIELLAIAFPEVVDANLRANLDTLSPGYTSQDYPTVTPKASEASVLDELIQMNIGEIRTRIHQLLLRPVLTAHCPAEGRGRLIRILDSLLADETKHIQYTARLIEKATQASYEFVSTTMEKRLEEFNQITLQEVGEACFEGA